MSKDKQRCEWLYVGFNGHWTSSCNGKHIPEGDYRTTNEILKSFDFCPFCKKPLKLKNM